MGTLETLRDRAREQAAAIEAHADDGGQLADGYPDIVDAAVDSALEDWRDAGCPGYEPEPWGEPGVVPTRPGRYNMFAPCMKRPRVWELLPSGVWTDGFRTIFSMGFPPDARFRYLAPLPTPPEAP